MHQVSGQAGPVPAYMTTATYGNMSAASGAPVDNTALEAHLSFLRHLQEQASNAASRACRMADRLLGAEPAMIGKGNPEGINKSVEPPLVSQVDEAARVVAQLLETVHQHLNRLERV